MIRLFLVLVGSGMFAAAFAVFRAVLIPVLRAQTSVPRGQRGVLPSRQWLQEHVPLTRRLGPAQWTALFAKMQDLLDTRQWVGCGGLELTDEIRHTVAAQAALLVIEIPGDPYPKLREILIYPATFRPRKFSWTPSSEQEDKSPLLGQSWHMGIVILAWDSAKAGTINPFDGDNVVLHEFSHQLDALDGEADGVPPLRPAMAYSAWTSALTKGFVQLCREARHHRGSVMDHYGTTNHAEFFAVATETFFEKPRQLKLSMPDLYAVLTEYYGQDPLVPPDAGGPTDP